jgi:HK97 family phage portal protein
VFVSNGSLVTTKTPLNISSGSSWFPSMPPMSNGWPSAYGNIYERQLWVYVVVSKRARATARLPLPVYERDELNRPRRDDHPLAQLLKKPNGGMSGFDLWLWTSSIFDIYGEAFWFKRRVGGAVREVYPFHPANMSWDAESSTWDFDNGTKRISEIKPLDLVHFRDFHPTSTTRGLSPLEPLRATLENEWSARTAISSFWQRGARPGTYITHPRNLSEPAQRRLKAQFNEVAAGSANTGTTILLEEGMEPKPMMLTAEEAQYIETRKLNREEVCAAYDIPPPVVHILDHATFSNITEQMRSMYRDTMAPHLQGFEATIERDLRSVEWPSDNVYAEFLMDDVLRGDFETRAAALSAADWMTLAEKRKVENLPFVEGTDRIFLNTASLPLDAIDAQYGPDQGAGADVIPLPVARAVMGRLSWQRSLDEVDAKSLTQGAESHEGPILQALAIERANGGDVASLRERIRALVKE